MRYPHCVAVGAALLLGIAAPASAQRYSFERSFDAASGVTLDAITNRGKITVNAVPDDRVIVKGTVTVRLAPDAPLDADAIARRLASDPPVSADSDRVQLRPPAEDVERRAVTIAYEVTVPAGAHVDASSDSGAIRISGVQGPVRVRTQSGELSLAHLGATAEVSTGSGAVTVDGIGGDLSVTTSSSAITAQGLHGDLRVKTGSGAVRAESTGSGDIDITTSSSAITIAGAAGGVRANSQSGRIEAHGRPGAPWALSTGSAAILLALDAGTNATLDATTGSGSIRLANLAVSGREMKRRVQGDIGSGGPTVTVTSRSGSLDIRGR
jgi:hypothetical protein